MVPPAAEAAVRLHGGPTRGDRYRRLIPARAGRRGAPAPEDAPGTLVALIRLFMQST